jgi:hypothetical protein
MWHHHWMRPRKARQFYSPAGHGLDGNWMHESPLVSLAKPQMNHYIPCEVIHQWEGVEKVRIVQYL